MASLIKLADDTYRYLAQQAAAISGTPNLGAFALAEAFPVFAMTPKKWETASFHATGLWHFQIKFSNIDYPIPAGYMRARIFGPREQDWEFCGLFTSNRLALGIENAVDIADRNDYDDTKEARLLVAPFYQVTTLWLSSKDTDKDLFIIAYAPESINIGENRILGPGQFREIIGGFPIIQGRVEEGDQQAS